jgi:Tol biopolymer transport system component
VKLASLPSTFVPTCWMIALGVLCSPAPARAQTILFGRLTTSVAGAQLDAGAQAPSVSPDGRFIAFVSTSTNLGALANGSTNLYRYDLFTDTYELATQSLGTGNSTAPSISEDGLAIAFQSEANDIISSGTPSGFTDLFYTQQATLGFETFLVSQGVGGQAPNGASRNASISADGRWVAFLSEASNLIGGDTNGVADIFVADANDAFTTPERVSVNNGGVQIDGPSRALSTNAISGDGRYVAFAVDTPVSIDGSNAGIAGTSSSDMASISPSGRYVVFRSFSTNLTPSPSGSRIYLRDRQQGTTTNMPLPPGAASCEDPRVTDRADILAQCNMSSGQAQVFLYKPAGGGAFYQFSTSITAGNGNGVSGNHLDISANGLVSVFDSAATDLVDEDTNTADDAFIVVPEPGAGGAALAAAAALAAIARRRGARRASSERRSARAR